jgi:hypothetical protein
MADDIARAMCWLRRDLQADELVVRRQRDGETPDSAPCLVRVPEDGGQDDG